MILIGAGVLCLLIGLGILVRGKMLLKDNVARLKAQPESPEFAVLIPARFESSVIDGLFRSLKKQTVKVTPRNVYVIVETLRDPTVKLAKKYGYKIIVREDTAGRERKGYALDEAVKQILNCRRYDLYFIFDADNILAPDYIEQMLASYAAGFEIVTGYRNIKNRQPNVVATSSSLVFSLLNTLSNHDRIRYGANAIFSGTGCFVDGKLIDEWRGWPFHSLTEDYELSLYATLHQLATFYNEHAVFYDEQPTKLKQSFDQRVRWIRGYFDVRKIYIPKMRKKLREARKNRAEEINCTNVLIQEYNKLPYFGSIKRELLGVKAVIWLVAGIFLVILGLLSRFFYANDWLMNLLAFLGILLTVYLVLLGVTIVLLKRERLDLLLKAKIRAVFYNPIFLFTFVPCALKAIFARDVKWTKIQHGESE